MYKGITTVDDLKELMAKEAEKWGRTDYEQAVVNRAGIEQQWETILEASEDQLPLPIFAMIHVDEVTERPDGTEQEGFFNIFAIWFDANGVQVEKPNLVIEKVPGNA